jgi:regulator of sigma E protease
LITTIVAFIFMLLILVFMHELGHFAVAMWMKIRVDEFGIGYPPRALTLFERNGVKYTLNWVPLGGFVRFSGEDNTLYGTGSLADAKPFNKILVMVAGPLMNLLLAILIFAAIFMIQGIPQPVGQYIGAIYEDTPAAAAGIQEGDILLELNGHPILDSTTLQGIGQANAGEPVEALIRRDGEEMTLTVVPGPWTAPNGEPFEAGFGFSYGPEMEFQPASIPAAAVESVAYTGELLGRMLEGLSRLVGGLFGLNEPPPGGVAGPIGIARATGEVVEQGGFLGFWNWTAILSINLFVLYLLPIPALDGSHILFSLIEWARGGKRLPPEKEALVHAIGFIALMGLILLVSIGDVVNAIQGVSVLGG